jgi:hypothetical protein
MVPIHYFTPFRVESPTRTRGCWTCCNFNGRFFCGHVLCERDSGRHVVGVPIAGCAFWMRAIGSDDE